MQTKDYMRRRILEINPGWIRCEFWEGSRRAKAWSKRVVRRSEKQNRFINVD